MVISKFDFYLICTSLANKELFNINYVDSFSDVRFCYQTVTHFRFPRGHLIVFVINKLCYGCIKKFCKKVFTKGCMNHL